MVPVVVIPAFQPGGDLLDLVQGLRAGSSAPVVVVDDGSGPRYAPLFVAVAAIAEVSVLTHASNLGKGRALRTGMEHVLRVHPSAMGVVTADADGQHAVEDVIGVIERLRAHPDAVILGARGFTGAVPLPNRVGNLLGRWVLARVTGLALSDAQTGLRGIPWACLPHLVELRSTGYEFETEMLLLACSRGMRIVEQPIKTIYFDGGRRSHFRPFRDSLRIAGVIARLVWMYTPRVCILATGGPNAMHRRINITLPEETVKLIDRVAPKGDRSRLIADAVVHYVQAEGRNRLRRRLREGARRRAERDLALTREWFAIDEEAWRRSER
jgi:glycosyltransferase involved in cell wall biosynthesis